MTDLRWGEAKDFFDPDSMGALPDLFVPDATVEDWQTVLDLVRACGWQWQYSQGDTVGPLPTAAEVFARTPEAETVSLRVWPVPGVLAIFWFWRRPRSTSMSTFGNCKVKWASTFSATF
ncbi:hypothetical protein AB0K12_20670 [Nonomuraea sp. NPDC049419]|uniref:hypothetical protein n=1 Tax=Nonomuraea sp. NPDC049419 TaxID=3155772 RepID=UPI003428EE18